VAQAWLSMGKLKEIAWLKFEAGRSLSETAFANARDGLRPRATERTGAARSETDAQ
jgi:hypothetical protein